MSKFKLFEIEKPIKKETYDFTFEEMKTKNPKLAGKTPHYLYTTDIVKWGKKKGIVK